MSKKNGYQSDDDTIRYKLNNVFFNNATKPTVKSPVKDTKKEVKDENNVRYKFPEARITLKPIDHKPKQKPKIKVNFWSCKQAVVRLNKDKIKPTVNRRHTVAVTNEVATVEKPKHSAFKVRKRVSFLPTPIFSDNHVPMVTVPDDLTINLNEEEANELREDLNCVSSPEEKKLSNSPPKHSKSSATSVSSKGTKRKHSPDETRRYDNDNELEYFSKYVVQKLRRMETNQRIYSENIINTALMLGQLGKLNGKSRISEI